MQTLVSLRQWILTVLMLTLPAAVGAASEVVRLSEPVLSDDTSETFGATLPENADVRRLADVMDESERWLGEPVVVSARIGQVCQKKGCFFIAQDRDVVLRVSFKDYGFFIPTDAGGKQVTFAGVIERVEVSSDEAEHFAEDLGDDQSPVVPGPAYTIVASAIRIPR